MKNKDFCLLKQNSSQLLLKNLSKVGDFLFAFGEEENIFEISLDLKNFSLPSDRTYRR